MLPEEKAENSRYFYELASGKFGWSDRQSCRCAGVSLQIRPGGQDRNGWPSARHQGSRQDRRSAWPNAGHRRHLAFHVCRVRLRRRLQALRRASQRGLRRGAHRGQNVAQHIEDDIDAALRIGVDYIILDGRGGGTGAAPVVFRDHISVPTIPALARARRHLDARGRRDVSLVVTGGLRTHTDFAKALALGADAVAVSNSAMQAIGCIGMRACSSNNCPVGIATQKPELRRVCRFKRRRIGLSGFLLPARNSWEYSPGRAVTHTCVSSAPMTSPPSTRTWPDLRVSPTGE